MVGDKMRNANQSINQSIIHQMHPLSLHPLLATSGSSAPVTTETSPKMTSPHVVTKMTVLSPSLRLIDGAFGETSRGGPVKDMGVNHGNTLLVVLHSWEEQRVNPCFVWSVSFALVGSAQSRSGPPVRQISLNMQKKTQKLSVAIVQTKAKPKKSNGPIVLVTFGKKGENAQLKSSQKCPLAKAAQPKLIDGTHHLS